ncbi:MAG: DUF1080 domain-containing protein [Acidobacteria bacterium]|nr:DUF1080 domain-containing protein [Acidobacteriota bacterium]
MRLLTTALWVAGLPAWCGDEQFNGRWNITVPGEQRARAWWLEVNGAGASALGGKFVGAPGGQMDVIEDLAIRNGELRFSFLRRWRGREEPLSRGVWTARLVKGELHGLFTVEGRPPVKWFGKRAPLITDKDDGSWREGQPVALFNGKDLTGWAPIVPGKPLGWEVKDGVLTTAGGANNLTSTQKFWNFALRIEYRVQKGSNSGIGLRGRYEVQIMEDYGRSLSTHSNGSLYSRIIPSANASKPPGEWQTYDLRLVGRQVTVVLNGVKIIDQGEIEGLTAVATDPNEDQPGPITLQGDHGLVEFRQIVLTPLVK